MTTRRPARALVALGSALCLSACVSIPTSGPVARGDVTVVEHGPIDVLAEGPRPGAAPSQVVEGFLLAGGAGYIGDFTTAREYLTGAARQDWQPRAGVIVADGAKVTEPSEGVVVLEVPVLARVDADGVYTEAAPGANESVTFELERDESDEWRIVSAPDGLIVTSRLFQQEFRPTPLYFLSVDNTYLVPETRWLPARKLQTSVARALLAGPSAWLQDAVGTAVPQGVQLIPESVTIDASGVAKVNLEPPRLVLGLDASTRGDLLAQFDKSLREVPSVGSVQVSTGGVPLDGDSDLQRAGVTDGPVEMVRGRALVRLVGSKLEPVPGVTELPSGAHDPARDAAGELRVFVTGNGALVTAPTAEDPSLTLVPDLVSVAPSVDRFGWVWTGRHGSGLLAVAPGAEPVEVSAPWLEGRTLRAVSMARDGTRLAVVSSGSDGDTIDVCAIVRDDTGAPQAAGTPLRVGAAMVEATRVTWIDDVTLGVLGRSTGGVAVHRVPVSGPTVALPEVPGIASFAGGRIIYATIDDGTMRQYGSLTWTVVPGVAGVRDADYPG